MIKRECLSRDLSKVKESLTHCLGKKKSSCGSRVKWVQVLSCPHELKLTAQTVLEQLMVRSGGFGIVYGGFV